MYRALRYMAKKISLISEGFCHLGPIIVFSNILAVLYACAM